MRTFGFALLAAGLLSGCTTPITVAGHTGGYGEVFLARGINDPSTTSWTAVLEPTKVTCTASGQMLGIAAWRNDIVCSDGRTGRVDTRMIDLSLSEGSGILSDGTILSIVRGIDGRPEERYREFKVQQMQPAPSAPAAVTAIRQDPTPHMPLAFPPGVHRPDDIAVIIGNARYAQRGSDIPDVVPAHADADNIRHYATKALGIRDGNVLLLKDATAAQLTEVFGNERDHRGRLFNWVKPGKSRVFVYYSGHGAPGGGDGHQMLVPVDASAAQIGLSGYPLDTLYANLAKIPAESITVVLEACFSGTSQAGSVIANASPVFLRPKATTAPSGITVISAGTADQVASWEPDKSSSLFTKYFLLGQSGEADKQPYGDGDGRVALDELDRYLAETLTYFARRHYGRDQRAQIVPGHGPAKGR